MSSFLHFLVWVALLVPSFAVLVVAVVACMSIVPLSIGKLMIHLLVSASSSKILVSGLGVRAPTIICLLVVVLKVLLTAETSS